MAIDNLNQSITPLTTFPDRPNYTSSSAYATAVATWLSEEGVFNGQIGDLVPKLEVMINQINSEVDAINSIYAAMEGLSGTQNFKGKWSAIYAGGYVQGDSVEYTDGSIYVSKVDNNTVEPTIGVTTAEWYYIERLKYSDLTLATLTKTFVADEEAVLTLSKPQSIPNITVLKEVPHELETSDTWAVDMSLVARDFALDTTLELTVNTNVSNATITLGVGEPTEVHVGMVLEPTTGAGKGIVISPTQLSILEDFANTSYLAGEWTLRDVDTDSRTLAPNGRKYASEDEMFLTDSTYLVTPDTDINPNNRPMGENYPITKLSNNNFFVYNFFDSKSFLLSPTGEVLATATGVFPITKAGVFETPDRVYLAGFYSTSFYLVGFNKDTLVVEYPSTAIFTFAGTPEYTSTLYDKANNVLHVSSISSSDSTYYTQLRTINMDTHAVVGSIYGYPGTVSLYNLSMCIDNNTSTLYVFTVSISKIPYIIKRAYGTWTTTTLWTGVALSHTMGGSTISYNPVDNTVNAYFSVRNDTSIKYLSVNADSGAVVVDVSDVFPMLTNALTAPTIDILNNYVVIANAAEYSVYNTTTSAVVIPPTSLAKGVDIYGFNDYKLFFKGPDDYLYYQEDMVPTIKRLNTGYESVGYTDKYAVAITASSISTLNWAEILNAVVDITENGQEAYLAFSTDNKQSFKIATSSGSTTIVQNDTVLQYWDGSTYVDASENNMFTALKEAMATVENRMTVAQLVEANLELGDTIDIAFILKSTDVTQAPVINGVEFEYSGFSTWHKATDAEYSAWSVAGNDSRVVVKALAENNLKIRVV